MKSFQIADKDEQTRAISEILAASVRGFRNKWEKEGDTTRNTN